MWHKLRSLENNKMENVLPSTLSARVDLQKSRSNHSAIVECQDSTWRTGAKTEGSPKAWHIACDVVSEGTRWMKYIRRMLRFIDTYNLRGSTIENEPRRYQYRTIWEIEWIIKVTLTAIITDQFRYFVDGIQNMHAAYHIAMKLSSFDHAEQILWATVHHSSQVEKSSLASVITEWTGISFDLIDQKKIALHLYINLSTFNYKEQNSKSQWRMVRGRVLTTKLEITLIIGIETRISSDGIHLKQAAYHLVA